VGSFGIGTYQSASGGTTVGSGFPNAPFQLVQPYAGTYGGTYGFVLDTTIKQPHDVTWTPVPEIGIDGVGNSVVRGFPQMVWNYPLMRPDQWYQFQWIYQQTARMSPGFQYLCLIQYPDPFGSGALIQQLAHIDPITMSNRTVAVFNSVQLKFTYIGQAQVTPGTPITVLS
jgi:hypothetical protein